MVRIKVAVALTLTVLAALFVTTPIPARPALDIPGSTWTAGGRLKAAIRARGQRQTTSGRVEATIRFGPQAGLSASEFRLLIDDGSDVLTFPGSYVLNTKGKVALTLDRSAAADAFTDVFVNLAAGAGGGALPDPDVTVKTAKLKAKTKTKASGDRIALRMNTKWNLDFEAAQRHVRVKMKLSLKAAGPRAP